MVYTLDSITNTINSLFSNIRMTPPTLPAAMLSVTAPERKGVSAIELNTNITKRLTAETGIDTGKNADGTANVTLGLVKLICEEVIKELQNESRVEIAFKTGDIQVMATGANAGGPVTVFGSNIIPVSGYGIIR